MSVTALPALPMSLTLRPAFGPGLEKGVAQGLRLALAALLCALALSFPALAKGKQYAAEGGVAIGGHDPVAYFTEGGPTAGDAAQALSWRGVTWYFDSMENRQAFEMNPAGYAPQFGGWCPVALAHGALVAGDPDLFRVRNGKLYLFETAEAANQFDLAAPALIDKAITGWKTIPRK